MCMIYPVKVNHTRGAKLENIVNIRKGVITDNARLPISITRYFIKAVLNVAIFVPICNLSPKL